MVGYQDNKTEVNKDNIYVIALDLWQRISEMEIHQR